METIYHQPGAISVILTQHLCKENYCICSVDTMLAGDHRPAFSPLCCRALITTASKHRVLIVVRPLSPRSALYSLPTVVYESRNNYLAIVVFILINPSEVLLFSFSWCPALITNAPYQVESPLCEGLSFKSVILILSSGG